MRISIVVAMALALACSASSNSTPNNAPTPSDSPAPTVDDTVPASAPAEGEPTAEEDAPAAPSGVAAQPPAAFELPDDVPPLDTPCETRLDFSSRRLASAQAFAAKGCTADADCVLASRSTGCRAACPTAVLAKHAEAYESFRASLDARVCSTYREDKCAYATPRCAKGESRCTDGVCTWARASR